MKDVALVTDVPFWQIGLGSHARIYELYKFLAVNSCFTLYYLGEEVPPFLCQTCCREEPQQLRAVLEKAHHDLIIVEYPHLHWIADFSLKGAKLYLDALDLFSERTKSFASFNRQIPAMTMEEELSCFRKFDKVLFLQKEEIEKALTKLGDDKFLLCPHPVVPEADPPFHEQVRTIGFFGSASWPNIDGVQWFHDKVLPLMGDLAQKCVAHGSINVSPLTVFSPKLAKGEIFSSIGDYYRTIDIAINPVLYGSGLKIKTVEAMAYGIPLVTTSAGAQGLLGEAGKAFLLADTPEEFAQAIRSLATSPHLRRRLSDQARLYALDNLTPHACFKALLH